MIETPLFSFLMGGIFGSIIYLLIVAGRPVNKALENKMLRFFLVTTGVLIIITVLWFFVVEENILLAEDHIILYHKILSIPVISIILGIAFGFVILEWIRYILLPVKLRTAAIRHAHTRWGFVALTLLALGAVYPLVPILMQSLNTLDLKGPGGTSLSLVLQQQSKETPPTFVNSDISSSIAQYQKFSTSKFATWTGVPQSLLSLGNIAKRDLEYAKLVHDNENLEYSSLESRHTAIMPFLDDVLSIFGACLAEHLEKLNNRPRLKEVLGSAVLHYRQMIVRPNQSPTVELLVGDFRSAAKQLEKDMSIFEDATTRDQAPSEGKNACASAGRKIDNVLNEKNQGSGEFINGHLDVGLPYASLGLSYLLITIGEEKAAAIELAEWLDTQFGGQTAADIKNCMERENLPSCDFIGYVHKSDSHHDIREILPDWYDVRVRFELQKLLETFYPSRQLLSLIEQNILTYQRLMSNFGMVSLDEWQKNCGKNAQERSSPQQRVAFALITAMNSFVYWQIKIAQFTPSEQFPLEKILEYGRRASAFHAECYSATDILGERPSDIWRAGFDTQYGMALAIAAGQNMGSSELEKSERMTLLKQAQLSLDEALEGLQSSVRKDIAYEETRANREKIFYVNDLEESRLLARTTLDRVHRLLSGP